MTGAKPSKTPERKKRRSLLEGPATRRALELADAEASEGSGGWKLLEPPPESTTAAATSGDQDPWKLLETPPEANDAPDMPKEFVDPTQPEASWKVVANHEPKPPSSEQDKPRRTEREAALPAEKATGKQVKANPPRRSSTKALETRASENAERKQATKTAARSPLEAPTQKTPTRKRSPAPWRAPVSTPTLGARAKRSATPRAFQVPRAAKPTPPSLAAPLVATESKTWAKPSPAATPAPAQASKVHPNYKRSFTPAAQVPRPVGASKPRPRMATLMGVQAPDLSAPAKAGNPRPPMASASHGAASPEARSASADIGLAKTMLGEPPPAPHHNSRSNATNGATLPKSLRSTMMGVAPPPLAPPKRSDTRPSRPDPGLDQTVLAAPPALERALPEAPPAPATRNVSRESFADTMLAGTSPVAGVPTRKSVAPPLPQVPPSEAALAAVPPPLPTPPAEHEEPQPDVPRAALISDLDLQPADDVPRASVAHAPVNEPVPAYPQLLRESQSEPSLSGLARSSVVPSRRFMRSPWLLAVAGVALLIVPLGVFALVHGFSSEPGRGSHPPSAERAQAKPRQRTQAAKTDGAVESAPPLKPDTGADVPQKSKGTEPAVRSEPTAVKPDTDRGTSSPETRPDEIPWQDREPTHTKPCKDLVDLSKPTRFSPALKAAKLALVRGDVDAAHQAFCEASLLSEHASPVLMGLAQVLLLKNDPESAQKVADQLIQITPKNTAAQNLMGDILIRMGKLEAAKSAWMRAAGATTLSASLRANLLRFSRKGARDAMRADDLARADRMLRRVLALDPSDVEAAAKLVYVLHKNGSDEAARLWLSYAATLDGNNEQVQRLRAALK